MKPIIISFLMIITLYQVANGQIVDVLLGDNPILLCEDGTVQSVARSSGDTISNDAVLAPLYDSTYTMVSLKVESIDSAKALRGTSISTFNIFSWLKTDGTVWKRVYSRYTHPITKEKITIDTNYRVEGLQDIKTMAECFSEGSSKAAIDSFGNAWVWDFREWFYIKEIGGHRYTTNGPVVRIPTKLKLENVKSIDAGYHRITAICGDGEIWQMKCITNDTLVPVNMVKKFTIPGAIKVISHIDDHYALTDSGYLYHWNNPSDSLVLMAITYGVF